MFDRWQRMCGKNTLWVPGTDHAGIATQMLVERQLADEGKTRQELGREVFVERVWQWRQHYGGNILKQMKRIGDTVELRAHFRLELPGELDLIRGAGQRLGFVHDPG